MSDQEKERIEEMGAFFDARADGYDEHIRGYVFDEATFAHFYQTVASPIEETDAPLRILDLGCGTGLELEALFQRAPNAAITGVDLSENMLDLLRQKYRDHIDQITLIVDSYFIISFGQQTYDYVVSVMNNHHFFRETKLALYRKIHAALKPSGKYIEGDAVTLEEMEADFLDEYNELIADRPHAQDGVYHIDIPFAIETQKSLLLEAGFKDFELLWQRDTTAVWNAAVYVVTD
ncbi:MAG: methyltransferase domain-containing protein [Anaerolineae bacterium]|nr:methyltransferase domain-containing protein [Anaerolineae bacterium]